MTEFCDFLYECFIKWQYTAFSLNHFHQDKAYGIIQLLFEIFNIIGNDIFKAIRKLQRNLLIVCRKWLVF